MMDTHLDASGFTTGQLQIVGWLTIGALIAIIAVGYALGQLLLRRIDQSLRRTDKP